MESYCKSCIIEFEGLPGSGKSTIARSFYQDILAEGTPIYYYSEIPKGNEKKCILEPSYFILFIKLVLLSFVSFHNIHIKQIYGMVVILYNYSRFTCKNEGILVVDQGIVQKILSLGHLKSLSEEIVRHFLRLVFRRYEKSTICIDVECNIEETIKRLQNRGNEGSRLNKINGSDLKSAMNIQSHNLDIIRKVIKKDFPKAKQVRINSIDSVQENISIIKRYI